jgi:16S rRNA C967 or C1407 C5-methylase (RsmB/RsmF family)/NOL1/NOP2/fmu family ribosome biogenesis protein
MQTLLGAEYADFAAALQTPPPVSVRLNPLRGAFVHPFAALPAIPWHPEGRYLPERPVFTLDPAFHAGAYYVQEASSMFLHEVLRQVVDFSQKLKILDLCAAPGGKSTLIASMLDPAKDLLVSNEVIRSRVNSLRENIEKWGAPHTAVSSAEATDFAGLDDWFDVVVTDAPCSGEGLFRKDPDATREWSPANVELCSGRQRRILASAVAAVAPGGILIYSTCTYNRDENDLNAAWVEKEFDLDPVRLDIPQAWNIAATEYGYQFFPHRTRGEGFFLSVFRKKEGPARKHTPASGYKNLKPLAKSQAPELGRWLQPDLDLRFFQTPSGEIMALPATLENDYLVLEKHLKTKWFGANIGEFKGKDFIPGHALALHSQVSGDLPGIELSREQALLFLKKETFERSADMQNGWMLARYQGLNLGWMKVLPNRLNNYLPPERRIRMELNE